MTSTRLSKPPRHARTTATEGYCRLRDLPRLLRLWPDEVGKLTRADQPWLVRRLAQVLRAERQLGLSKHWSYDVSRHAALLRAWRAEKALLQAVEAANRTLSRQKPDESPALAGKVGTR